MLRRAAETKRTGNERGLAWLYLPLWGYLAHHGGALLHGAVCFVDGRFVMLLGDKGVGKSTLGRLVADAGGTCLTEEYPVLTWHEDRAWAHGTPWNGLLGPPCDLSGPLDAVFFLRHAPAHKLSRLTPAEAGQRLLENTRFFTWDPATIPPTVELLDRTARTVPVYDFGFMPDQSAVERLREVL